MNLKEVTLTTREYSDIKEKALQKWLSSRIEDSNYNVICIVSAFLLFCKINNLVVKDGNIYKDEQEKLS